MEYDNHFINGLAEIRNFTKPIDFNEFTYNFTDNSAPISFIDFKGSLHISKSIYNGDMGFRRCREKGQIKFKSDLDHIKQ